ncbi:MAG: hypothetical protein ABFD89_11075 [Bryobacteraceae bacterium]
MSLVIETPKAVLDLLNRAKMNPPLAELPDSAEYAFVAAYCAGWVDAYAPLVRDAENRARAKIKEDPSYTTTAPLPPKSRKESPYKLWRERCDEAILLVLTKKGHDELARLARSGVKTVTSLRFPAWRAIHAASTP